MSNGVKALAGFGLILLPLAVALGIDFLVTPMLGFSVQQSDWWGGVQFICGMTILCYAVVAGIATVVVLIGAPIAVGINLIKSALGG